MAARQSSPAKSLFVEDLVIMRVFDAPRETVWKAWTEPKHFMRWWGPKGFTSPDCEIDLCVGGKYLYCMLSPEGQDYWSTGRRCTVRAVRATCEWAISPISSIVHFAWPHYICSKPCPHPRHCLAAR